MINNDPVFPRLDDLDFPFDPLGDAPAPASELVPVSAADLRNAARAAATAAELSTQRRTYRRDEFVWDNGADQYWCIPLRAARSALGVDSMIPKEHWRTPPKHPNAKKEPDPIPPSKDIRANESDQQVEGATWLPGYPTIVEDIVANERGIENMRGARMFNLYVAPAAPPLELAEQAAMWVEHVRRLYPEPLEHEYFFDYCAHMVQRPQQKCNAALVISGKQGIGKDFMLLPLRGAVGNWNAANIAPDALLSQYNPWAQSVMLMVDEVRMQQDDHRATAMYDSMKTLMASPPDVLPVNNKFEKMRYVANVLRLFLTTNDRLALYIPPDDRRILVMHSPLQKDWHISEGDPGYFDRHFRWMHNGGAAAVAAWLRARDISQFQPNGLVPRSGAWREVQQSWEAADDEVTVALETLGEPDVVLGSELTEAVFDGQERLIAAMRSKAFVFRMQKAGYVAVGRPAGITHWRAKHAGHQVKSAQAYVKEALGWPTARAQAAAQERARCRAEAGRPLVAERGEF